MCEGSFVWCVNFARVIGRKMAVAHSTTFCIAKALVIYVCVGILGVS